MSNNKKATAKATANTATLEALEPVTVALPYMEEAANEEPTVEPTVEPSTVEAAPSTHTRWYIVAAGIVVQTPPLTLEEALAKLGTCAPVVAKGKPSGSAPRAPKREVSHASTVASPVAYVRARVPELLKAGYVRKQIIEALTSEGIAWHTACTQYAWVLNNVELK